MLVLLLATAVSATNHSLIPRYSDFPLDNIHILRLQEASRSLGGNVSEMKQELEQFRQEQNSQMLDIRTTVDSFQRSSAAQLAELRALIDEFGKKVEQIPSGPRFEAPTEIKFPPYLVALLGITIFLLVVVIILIFWLREQYYVHRETHAEGHIHPAPAELIAYVGHALQHDKSLKDIRMELAGKGWSPSIIEHAIHAAKEK